MTNNPDIRILRMAVNYGFRDFTEKGTTLSKVTDSKNRTEVRFPVELKRDMRVYCAKNDMTIRECIISAVRNMIGSDSDDKPSED